MKVYSNVRFTATEQVVLHDRSDINVTVLKTGDPDGPSDFYLIRGEELAIDGTRDERAAFLRRLAEAALAAAAELDLAVEVA